MYKLFGTFILLAVLLSACGDSSINDKEDVLAKRNKRILGFNINTVMDMDELVQTGDKEYQALHAPEFNPKTDTLRFDKNHVYISYLSIVNGCGEYVGDIDFKNDSIYLKLINVGSYECTEQRVDRVRFKIANPDDKKYKVVKW